MPNLSRIFFRGLLAILPIGATIFVLVWLYNTLESALGGWIRPLLGEHYLPGTGLAMGLVLVFVMGLLLNAWIVRQTLAMGESLLERLPLAKTVLHAVRDMMGFFSGSQGKGRASQVVMVKLAGDQLRVIGLVTRSDLTALPAGLGGGDRVAVYFPMSYQLGGFMAMVPRHAVEPLDMGLEDAMRFVLTAGVKSE